MFSCTGMGRRDSSLDFGFELCSFDSGVDADLDAVSMFDITFIEGLLTCPAASSCCHFVASG